MIRLDADRPVEFCDGLRRRDFLHAGSLTALGLYWRIPLAGFVACFIFIGPGVAEFTHFIFPLIKPAILPDDPQPIT